MTLRLIINATLSAVLILALQVTGVSARCGSSFQNERAKSSSVVSRATYNRVLDILFPRDDHDPTKTAFAFILRFKPSFKPESQIMIRGGLDKVEVVAYTSLDGNIYSKVNDTLARTGKEDAVEMAKLVRGRKRAIEVPYSQLKQWHLSLLNSVGDSLKAIRQASEEYNKAGTVTVTLDGTTYDLWYEQGLNKMSFSLYDEEVDDLRSTGNLKLVQWMNTVRRDVEKLR